MALCEYYLCITYFSLQRKLDPNTKITCWPDVQCEKRYQLRTCFKMVCKVSPNKDAYLHANQIYSLALIICW